MHQVMLADKVRIDAYDSALARLLKPGEVVIDAGAGCLALTLCALRRGAGHVYAIEGDPATAALARAIVADNALGARVTIIEADARDVILPEKADIIVSEMMGNIGPEEEMAEILALVAARHLKPGGRVIPERLITEIRAIGFDREGWGVWSDGVAGFSLRAVKDHLGSSAQFHSFARQPDVLSPPVVLLDSRLGEAPRAMPAFCDIPLSRGGRLDALALSFTARFGGGITLSNFPGYPGCNWAVLIWPLAATEVSPGERLRASVQPGLPFRDALSWRVSCGRAAAASGDAR